MATMHLLQSGYRDIVYLGMEDERVMGYYQARMEHGLPVTSDTVFFAKDLASGYDVVPHILAQGQPRAIVAGSDEVAFGVLRRLREHNIVVPQAIALASIDNIPMAAYACPPLTSVNVPKMNMGRVAVEVLVNYERDAQKPPILNILPTKLIVRQSCGTPLP
jgi:LacI family transcriptional regulator